MKHHRPDTPLTDDYLNAFEGRQQAETGPFFYAGLKSKMALTRMEERMFLPLKPVWTLALLVLFLLLNATVLLRQNQQQTTGVTAQTGTLADFAAAYDQTLSPSF